MVRNALVIGGGIGGLSSAIALAQRGIAVTVVEQAAEIKAVGAGLQISPNGLAVLRALGVEPLLDKTAAVEAQAVVLEDYSTGRQVARLDLTRLKDQRYLFAHRADLIDALLEAASNAGVSIELDRTVTKVTPGLQSEVTLKEDGRLHADLVVCADGLRSVGRAAINGHTQPQFTGQVAWRATVPASNPDPVARVTMGPGRHIVSYPLRGGHSMNIVAVEERNEWAAEGWNHLDNPINLRQAFTDFGGSVGALLEQVEQVHLWGLFRHPVASTWVKERAVLLGDAAHPTLPFLAQGANMALEDAWVLAAVVSGKHDLKQYQALRRERASRIVAAASNNAWKYHLKHGPVRWAAHNALSLGSRITPGLMIRQFDWLYRYDVTDPATLS